jgi:hypothetical protein
MKIDYSRDRDTIVSYRPFFLLKKGRIVANFLDANLIRVTPECRDTGRLACLYRGAFDQKCIFSEVLKECVKKKMLGMELP